MFPHSHKPSLAGFVVLAGLLAAPAAAPAAAGYEHNQTNLEFLRSNSAITDGTSNTVLFGELSIRPTQA